MFGSHVEHQIEQVSKKAKSTKAAENLVRQKMDQIFREDSEEPKESTKPARGRFADPADRFG